jgi:ribosomal protein L24
MPNSLKIGDRVLIIRGQMKGWTGIVEGINDWKGDIEANIRLENYYDYEKTTGEPFRLAGIRIEYLEKIEDSTTQNETGAL